MARGGIVAPWSRHAVEQIHRRGGVPGVGAGAATVEAGTSEAGSVTEGLTQPSCSQQPANLQAEINEHPNKKPPLGGFL